MTRGDGLVCKKVYKISAYAELPQYGIASDHLYYTDRSMNHSVHEGL